MTNPMPPQDIDHIIRLIEQIADAAQAQHVQSTIQPLQKQLKLYLAPRWDLIWPYTTQAYNNPFYKQQRRAYGNVKYDLQQDIEKFFIENLNWRRCAPAIAERSKKVVEELECVKAKLEYNQKQFPATTYTEPNTTPAKRQRIKPILCAISAVVIFLAALLTVFHYLGWLEKIKAFIYNILQLE